MARGVASCHSIIVLRGAGHGRSSDHGSNFTGPGRSSDHGRSFAGHALCSFGRHEAIGDAVDSRKIEWRTLARGSASRVLAGEEEGDSLEEIAGSNFHGSRGRLGEKKKDTGKGKEKDTGDRERDNVVGPI